MSREKGEAGAEHSSGLRLGPIKCVLPSGPVETIWCGLLSEDRLANTHHGRTFRYGNLVVAAHLPSKGR